MHVNQKAVTALVALVALGVSALFAAGASATVVTPPASPIVAESNGNTAFIPENAYAEKSIQCENSEAAFETPSAVAPETQNNTNETGVGARSTGPGSVTMNISPSPSFTNCEVYIWVEPPGAWFPTGVPVTVNTGGGWSVAATQIGSTSIAAIAVPEEGAEIVIETKAGNCPLIVSPIGASSVNAVYDNSTSELDADGQIEFADPFSCSGFNAANPAQFEGSYAVGGGFEIH
jgi:hypothetical protein